MRTIVTAAAVAAGLIAGGLANPGDAAAKDVTWATMKDWWSGRDKSVKEVAGATAVDAKKAKKLFDEGITFVDPRSDSDWQAGRIPWAQHLELHNDFNQKALKKIVKKDEPVLFYCNGPECFRSSKAARAAVKMGWDKVYYFRGGFPAWKAAGYPTE